MQVFVRAKICPDPCKRGLSVQVWDLKKAGQLFGLESNTATGLNFARIRVNTIATEFARIHVNRRSRDKIRPRKNLSRPV